MSGLKIESAPIRTYDYETVVGGITSADYPKKFTLSRSVSIKNQKLGDREILECAGCAGATILEYIFGKQMSEMFIYGTHRDHKTPGLYLSRMLEGLRKVGAVPLADFGIKLEVPELLDVLKDKPELLQFASNYRIKGYANLNYANAEKKDRAIKDALSRPKEVALLAATNYWRSYHAIAIDGWDDDKDVYTLQNSYGREWGNNGYGELPKNEVEEIYAIFFEEINLPFTDVEPGRWSEGAIKNMLMSGLMTGTTTDTFSPEEPLTREQFAVVQDRKNKLDDERFMGIYDILNYILERL